MNYYEISSPYYALIKSINVKRCVDYYIENVAGEKKDFDEIMKECRLVENDYAVAKYSRCLSEDGELVDLNEILRDLKSTKEKVLIIDGSLL